MDRVGAGFTQQSGFFMRRREFPTEFAPASVAAFTHDERFTLFNPDYRDKKDLKIMIDALFIGLGQTALWTTPGILVYNFYFWEYADYKKHVKQLATERSRPESA